MQRAARTLRHSVTHSKDSQMRSSSRRRDDGGPTRPWGKPGLGGGTYPGSGCSRQNGRFSRSSRPTVVQWHCLPKLESAGSKLEPRHMKNFAQILAPYLPIHAGGPCHHDSHPNSNVRLLLWRLISGRCRSGPSTPGSCLSSGRRGEETILRRTISGQTRCPYTQACWRESTRQLWPWRGAGRPPATGNA